MHPVELPFGSQWRLKQCQLSAMFMREAIERLPYLDEIDSVIFGLRWLALALVFFLSFFDRSSEGVLVPTLYLIPAVAGFPIPLQGRGGKGISVTSRPREAVNAI